MLIERTYKNKPHRFLSCVKLTNDGKYVFEIDGAGCEFISETEGITNTALDVVLWTLEAAGVAYTIKDIEE